MKSIRFWRMTAKDLSMTEQMFYRDAIRTLLEWNVLKEEYPELDLIKRVLETEIPCALSEERPQDEPLTAAAG